LSFFAFANFTLLYLAKISKDKNLIKITWSMLLALDRYANTLLFGAEHETISSRLGKKEGSCLFCFFICRLLDLFEKNHCLLSIEREEKENKNDL
jgi:hypothetical protein